MKLVIIGKWPSLGSGGVATYTENLVSGMKGIRGLSMRFISFCNRRTAPCYDNMTTVFLRSYLIYRFLPFLALIRLAVELRRANPDAIIVQGINPSPYLICALLFPWRAKRMVIIHASVSRERVDLQRIRLNSLRHRLLVWFEMKAVETMDIALVVTPNLKKIFPSAILVERPYKVPLETDDSAIEERRTSTIPRIVHMPSNWKSKGTEIVTGAMRLLREEGLQFEFDLVSDVSHEESIHRMARSDLVIDQVNPSLGAYGMVSIEAMAMGKTAVCYLDWQLYADYPIRPPIISPEHPTSVSLAEIIKQLLYLESDTIEAMKKSSHEYVNRLHNPEAVARTVIDCFEIAYSRDE